MEQKICDCCNDECSDNRISIDSLYIWVKGVGTVTANNLDYCCMDCLKYDIEIKTIGKIKNGRG